MMKDVQMCWMVVIFRKLKVREVQETGTVWGLSGFETSVVYMLLYVRVASCFMNMRVGPDYI